jgi:mycothiol synthase
MREDWFDPAGFRLHEIDGRLAAFCWTKIHRGEPGLPDPAGEIYVIGVDPDFQGRSLGRQLTLAGLDAIGAAGVTDALLYVDAANAAATRLYTSLGFQTHRSDTAYVSPG